MQRARRSRTILASTILAASTLVVGASAAHADVPDPTTSPGCNGNIIAAFNQEAGHGLGYFARSRATSIINHALRDLACP